jgi:PhnB protein
MHLSTYLLFEGNCKQAMEHYFTVFGGELNILLVGESPMKGMFPESMHHKVLNAMLKSTHVEISASDWLRPTEAFIQGNNVSLYISGGTVAETKAIYSHFIEGANVTDPLTEQPFGLYGALQDRFGVCWKFHAAIN